MATLIPATTAEFTLSEVARVTAGELRGDDAQVAGVCTDTRCFRSGELYVALVGERFDGHDFAAVAASKGAAGMVLSDASAAPEGASFVLVDDTLLALGELARHHRERLGTRVITITGSAGKTTTKELMASALRALGLHVLSTQGNLNNRIGLPLTLLGLTSAHDVAVVEMGTSEPGEIARLTQIARPDVGLLTLVAAAHTLGLGSIEQVAAEKGAMLRGLGPHAIAIANGDDAFARRAAASSSARQVRLFGRADDCDVRIVSAEVEAELSTLAVYELRGEPRLRSLRLRLLGDSGAMNVAAVLAVVRSLDLDVSTAVDALCAASAVEGRMRVVDPAASPLLIDDTYNSNPRSLEMSLRASAALAEARGGRLVAVLGDMLELGERAAAEHRTICALVSSLGARALVGVGPAMRDAIAASAERLRGVATEAVVDSAQAADPAARLAQPRDVVLLKGSRGLRMERALMALTDRGAA